MTGGVVEATDEVVGTLLLTRVRTGVEAELLEEHVARWGLQSRYRVVQIPRSSQDQSELRNLLRENWDLQPLGVLWRPAERDGRRLADMGELLRGINPYRPSARQQHSILRKASDRARVVAGTPASVATLRARWEEEGHTTDEGEFVAHVVRRARLSLERAERSVLGPVFKSPKLVKDEILASQRFHKGLAALAEEIGSDAVSLSEAEAALGELATGWSRLAADLVPALGRRTFEKGFDPTIDTDRAEIDRLRRTVQDLPTVYLWSHRSNMDNPVLTMTLYDEGLAMPHTFAGINMAFGPIGMLYRRAGTIFIRRNIGDDPLYKHVLKEFVGYLMERRFDLSWSIEGTRSRTGKMLPPKLGLLSYAADAYLDGRTEDIALQPVTITFDQLDEIDEYARYASGGAKQAEGMKWFVEYVRSQGKRYFGKAYVRFPEPVSMRSFLGSPDGEIAKDPARKRLALQKMAFEVAWRINQATPITPTALLSSILLGSRGLGLTSVQVHRALGETLDHLEKRGLPTASGVEALRTVEGVEHALDALADGGPVTVVRSGPATVWLIGPDKQLAATFYRNSIVHVFLDSAITEIASMSAACASVTGHDAVEEFWRVAFRLRDLLKFEFYFQDKEEHRVDLEKEMLRLGENWEKVLAAGPEVVSAKLTERLPLTSSFTIRPFLEAYTIVADVLVRSETLPERKKVVELALGLGEQYVAQRRVVSREPVSALLFDTALQLFAQQGLLTESEDRVEKTVAVQAELRGLLGLIVQVERVAEATYLHHQFGLPAPAGAEEQALPGSP